MVIMEWVLLSFHHRLFICYVNWRKNSPLREHSSQFENLCHKYDIDEATNHCECTYEILSHRELETIFDRDRICEAFPEMNKEFMYLN